MSEKSKTSASGSRKYVLQFSLPDGTKMVATRIKGKFALTPVSENRAEGMFLIWDTPHEVVKFLQDLKENNPRGDLEQLLKLKPRVVAIIPMN